MKKILYFVFLMLFLVPTDIVFALDPDAPIYEYSDSVTCLYGNINKTKNDMCIGDLRIVYYKKNNTIQIEGCTPTGLSGYKHTIELLPDLKDKALYFKDDKFSCPDIYIEHFQKNSDKIEQYRLSLKRPTNGLTHWQEKPTDMIIKSDLNNESDDNELTCEVYYDGGGYSGMVYTFFYVVNTKQKAITEIKYGTATDHFTNKLEFNDIVEEKNGKYECKKVEYLYVNFLRYDDNLKGYFEITKRPPVATTPVKGCDIVPPETQKWITDTLNLVKYVALALVIVLGALDFIKAAASGEADQMKKSGQDFLKRVIAVVILFLVPVIVEMIINLVEIVGANNDCFGLWS